MTTPTTELLTDDEIAAALASITNEAPARLPPGWRKFARAIERALLARLGEQQPVGISMAAQWVRQRQIDFIAQHGSTDPDTGDLSFGQGAHAEAKREYVGELDEIIEGIEGLAKCDVPPEGWNCTRGKGHAGPCAAHPSPAPDQQATPKTIPDKDLGAINECQQATPSPAPVGAQELTTCNCRWRGETLVQQCTLHEAHRDAIHDWAARAKKAEAELAARSAAPEVGAQEREAFEAWFKVAVHDRLCRNMPDGSYNCPSANAAWQTWQAARSAAQGAVQVPAWQPINEAPKDGTVILLGFVPAGRLHADDRRVFEGRWNEHQSTWTSVNGFIVLTGATHYQPLPAAPAHAGERQGDSNDA